MATALAQMTAEAFENLPECDRKLELNNGMVVEVDMALAGHEKVKAQLNRLLVRALSDDDFVVAPEAVNRLSENVDRVPDLAIWRLTEFMQMDSDRTIVGGPLIAIEVVSSETAQELDEKIRQYFAAGTQLVWVVYPRTRAIEIERPNGSTRLSGGDLLQAPELIPGLSVPVSAIFALLEQD